MIIRFILIHLKSNAIRSVVLFVSILLSSLLSFLFFSSYRGTIHILEYYSLGEVNPLRFTLSRPGNLLSFFNQGSESGIDYVTLGTLEKDTHIASYAAFSLFDVPAIIRIGALGYALESDIPVFSVSDSLLCKQAPCETPTPLGVSRILLDFYNLNIAGTAEFFPTIPEALIRKREVTLTLGDSRRFDYGITTPFTVSGAISSITEDFPSMGVTLPESIARASLAQIGKTLPRPFRIIGYARTIEDIPFIRETYARYSVRFDTDAQAQIREKIGFLRFLFEVFTGVNLVVLLSIMSIFIFDILRQYAPLFRTFRMLGVSVLSNFAIVVGEVVVIGTLALMLSLVIFRSLFHSAQLFIMNRLTEIGISLPLFPIDWREIFLIAFLYILFLIMLGTLFSSREILKKWE